MPFQFIDFRNYFQFIDNLHALIKHGIYAVHNNMYGWALAQIFDLDFNNSYTLK